MGSPLCPDPSLRAWSGLEGVPSIKRESREKELWLTWHSAGSYRKYTACMTEWAQDLIIEPEQVEQLIFRGN
ncbi:hypothetical protein GCM10011577_32960 [Pseudarthrobacter polychromogenes]|uniref:Uncharacterized protein n=1 Tax=Pseudarthrobacter polychromogenes TaxID=1676 RepID=A0ABQ1XX69_9MICC|nr:hypothetical protein GCM10011577_32960 [Pseudarthrobacter polychromogenes]